MLEFLPFVIYHIYILYGWFSETTWNFIVFLDHNEARCSVQER